MFSSICISTDAKSKHYTMVIEKLKLLLLVILNVVLKVHLLWFKAGRMRFWKDVSLKVFVAASRWKFWNFLYTKYSIAENSREKLKISPKSLSGVHMLGKISRGYNILGFMSFLYLHFFNFACERGPSGLKLNILCKNSKLWDFIYLCFLSPKFLRDQK